LIGSAIFAGLTSVTDKQTDRHRQNYSVGNSVTTGRMYVHSTAMRPSNNNNNNNNNNNLIYNRHSVEEIFNHGWR